MADGRVPTAMLKALPVVLASASVFWFDTQNSRHRDGGAVAMYRTAVQQTLLLCAAGDVVLVWEHAVLFGTLVFCLAFIRLLFGIGFSPLKTDLLAVPFGLVGCSVLLIKLFEDDSKDAASGSALLVRYLYVFLLIVLGWRLWVISVQRRWAFHFFLGILINAFLFKASLLSPGMNFAARMVA